MLMRKIGVIALLDLQQLLRNRSQLLGTIVLPLILTVFFGLMLSSGGNRVAVALADEDGTDYSRELAGALTTASYEVRTMSRADADAAVRKGEVAAAVHIPQGLGDDVMADRPVEIVVVKNPRDIASLAVVETMRGATQRMAGNLIAVQGVARMYGAADPRRTVPLGTPTRRDVYVYANDRWEPDPPVSVRTVNVQRSAVRSDAELPTGFSQYSLGFTVTFMVFMALAGAGGFLEEREIGTLRRLLTTPTRKATLIGGKVAGIFATTVFQAVVMVVLGVLVFAVPWGREPIAVAVVLAAHGLAATGLGVMLSTMVRTRGQLSSTTAVLAISMAMLGGCYWPIEIVSPTMRAVGMLTPNYWAMQALVAAVVRNQGLPPVIGPTAVLLGFALVFFAIGLASLKFE